MPPSPVHDRRESASRPREMRPLFTHEPLSRDRERRPPAQPSRRRKRAPPATPALTFDPRCSVIPPGRRPTTPPGLPRQPAPGSPASPYDEQQTTPLVDREVHGPFYGYDGQRWLEHDAQYANMDVGSVPPDSSYDSPASHTSSSSPAPSDQSPAEFALDYSRQGQPSTPVCPLDGYVPQVAMHHPGYGYSMDPYPDRPTQAYQMQLLDAPCGRSGLPGGPVYPGTNGHYAPSRQH